MPIIITNTRSSVLPLAVSIVLFCSSITAHSQGNDQNLLASWVALDAPTGHEHLATDKLLSQFAGWEHDRYGNLIKSVGAGRPHRVVACALDSYSYAVSQITDDGYLRLHRIGSGSGHPLWDQAHEGQHLRILTANGPLIGVTAIANGHFAAQHRHETAIVSENDLWLDVGAESAAEVQAMGIALLDPVTRQLPAWSFANEIAGPRSGARVGCAAVMAAAQTDLNAMGSTTYIMSVQQVFGWIGLGAAIARLPVANELIVLGPGADTFTDSVIERFNARVDTVLASRMDGPIRLLSPAVSNSDSLMERVTVDAANQLLRALVTRIDPDIAQLPMWLSAPAPDQPVNGALERWGSGQNITRLVEIEAVLDQVAELSAVPGHEGPVRHVIYNALPDWAQQIAEIDDMGNLWVEFGPVSEATVFVAHMDEVGFEIESIDPDGVVNLTRLGGVVTTAWEGQPALLQLDPYSNRESLADAPQMRGVFLTRSAPETKQPDAVRAWFGMDATQLASAGVRVGMGVTGYKEGHRMGLYRYASRSLDDRVGTIALLRAIQQIDPARLNSRVVFAWSVREEGGLRGAAALAARLGLRARRAYSIDTFVSSDTPLESPHFAYAPLGSGPVLRAIENAAMSTPAELRRNRAIADAAGITVQIGLTQGSTDGTTFTPYGAPNAGLSWPGRYSHSPAEIADLRDVAGLIDLIQALAMANVDYQ